MRIEEFERKAQLGVATCTNGKNLLNASFFYKGERKFRIDRMLDSSNDHPLEQGINPRANVEINVNNFYIQLQSGEHLKSAGLLGQGGYGSVYKFANDSHTSSAAVKFMFVEVGVTEQAFAQSSFDMRSLPNYSEITMIQSNMDCPVVFSIHFVSRQSKVQGINYRLEITVMEEAKKTLSSYLETHFFAGLLNRQQQLHILKTLLTSIIDNFLCITQHNTVFPDIKVENMAIACDPNKTQILFIDVDGLLTLRTKDGKVPFPRFGPSLRQIGRMPIATYAPGELAVDGADPFYDETKTIFLSLYAFLVTLIDIICIFGMRTRINPSNESRGPQGLRGLTAKEGYTQILLPKMKACFNEIRQYSPNEDAENILELLQVINLELEWLCLYNNIVTANTDPNEAFSVVQKTAQLCKRRISSGVVSMDTTTLFRSYVIA